MKRYRRDLKITPPTPFSDKFNHLKKNLFINTSGIPVEICIDFDGTCVTHEYPNLGSSIGSEPVLKDLVKAGHKLILFTMRSGNTLDDAVNWFEENDIELYGINENPTQKEWTESPKAYGQLYIDDSALGIPLVSNTPHRPYVDWPRVRNLLEAKCLL